MSYTNKTVDEIVAAMWQANQDAQTALILGTAELAERAKLAEQPVEPDLPDKPIDPGGPSGNEPPDLPNLGGDLEEVAPDTFTPGSGDTITFGKGGDPLFVLRDKHIVCNGRTGVISHSRAPEAVTVGLHNIHFAQYDVAPHWAMCLNHIVGLISGVTAEDIGHDVGDGRVRDGHALYSKLLGDLTIRHFYAFNCAGQAMQLVTRPDEGPVPDSITLRLDGVKAHGCSSMPSRGSAMLALYCASTGEGTDIYATALDLRSDIGLPAKPKQQASTRGAIQVWADGHENTGAFFAAFRCDHLHIEMALGDRHPLDFKDCVRVHIAKITGSVEEAFDMHNGLPVLIRMTPYGPGGIEIEDTAFPFCIRVDDGGDRTYIEATPGEPVSVSW